MSDFGRWGFVGPNSRYLELPGGSLVGVSSPGRARLRYHEGSNTLEVSLDSGEYEEVGTGAASDLPEGIVPELQVGLPVLNVTTDLVYYGYDANAEVNVEGGGDAIQDAIDYYLLYSDAFSCIYIPAGLYRLTRPLLVRNGTGTARMKIVGGAGTSAPGAGAILRLDGDGTFTASEQAVLLVQGAVDASFEGLSLLNTGNPAAAAVADLGGVFSATSLGDWVVGTTSRTAPCAALAVDPFTGNPAEKYPGFPAGFYGNSSPSSRVRFSGCTFSGGYVGTAVGAGSSASDSSPKEIVFENCFWSGNGISCGGSGEGVVVSSGVMELAYCHFDNVMTGVDEVKGPPRVEGNLYASLSRYLFSIACQDDFSVHGMTAEEFISMGDVNGQDVVQEGLFSVSASIFLMATATNQDLDVGETAYALLCKGKASFEGCKFGTDLGDGPLIVVTGEEDDSILSFSHCSFLNSGSSNVLSMGISNPIVTRVEGCMKDRGSSVFSYFFDRWEEIPTDTSLAPFEPDPPSSNVRQLLFAPDPQSFLKTLPKVKLGDVLVAPSANITRVDGTTALVSNMPVGVILDLEEVVGGDLVTVGYCTSLLPSVDTQFSFTRLDIAFSDAVTYQRPNVMNNVVIMAGDGLPVTIDFMKSFSSGDRLPIGTDYQVLVAVESGETISLSNLTATSFDLFSDNPASVSEVFYQVIPAATYGDTI